MAEWKEDLERAFNIMNEELLKAEYKARVGYYWKYMDEIMEEVAKETKSYKQLEEENKKLKEKVRFLEECLDRKEKLNEKYRKELKSTYVYDAKQVRDIC